MNELFLAHPWPMTVLIVGVAWAVAFILVKL